MMMHLSEQIHVPSSPELSRLCHASKNLYNEANWYVRQEYFYTGKWLRYGDLAWMLKSHRSFKAMPAATAQQTLRIVDKNWASFFAAMRAYREDPSKFTGRSAPPGYKERDGEFVAVFTNEQIKKIKDGCIHFPARMPDKPAPVKTRLTGDTVLKEVRVVPRGTDYTIEIVHEKREQDLVLDRDRVLAIDIGLNNLVTTVDNTGGKPVIVRGGAVKSINQFYNKQLARYRSILNKHGIFKESKRIRKLHWTRECKIKDIFHEVSREIVDRCIRDNIGTIVVGYNERWKQGIELGKRNNQNFVQVPFDKLLKMIEYKGRLVGIDVRRHEESYTSKASLLDLDAIPVHGDGAIPAFSGMRISRGLYRSSNGTIINADVNGAGNILRKAVPNALWADGIEAAALQPVVLSINDKIQTRN